MAVGQIAVTSTPLLNHFHVLKDHGERKVCGFSDALFLPAPMCLAPKSAVQSKEKHEIMLQASESFAASADGTIKSTIGSLTETQTPAAIMQG